jgi:Fungal specific transcription factor domain
MDGGILQKEKSLKYKAIVGKAKAKRERQLLAHGIYSSQNLHTELDLLQAEKPGLLDTLSVPVYQYNALNENVAVQAHSEGLIDEADEMLLCPFNQFPLQSLTHPMANLNAMTPPFSQNMETGGILFSTGSSERVPRMSNDSPGLLDAQWTSMIAVDTALATNGPTASTAGEFMSVTPRNSSEVHAYPSYEFATLAHVLTEDACPPRPSPPNEPILGQEAEDTLFMHYFDQVFYLQFPFYHPQGTLQRGWLFSILRRVKPAYYATLALSERHLIATGVSPMSSETRYYDLALQGMQLIIKEAHTLTGHVRILRCLDGLTCILQLLFWKVCATPSTIYRC